MKCEVLEDRSTPAILTVNTAAGGIDGADGKLSLPEAMLCVNVGNSNLISAAEKNQVSGAFGSGDVVLFDGVATPIILSNQIAVTKSVLIDGSFSPSRVFIEGALSNRIFEVSNPANLSLRALSLTEGNAKTGNGGGILAHILTTVTLDNVTLANCAASNGGAIDTDGNLIATNTKILSNTATTGGGGGIRISGALTLTGCNVSGNTAENQGGGVEAGSDVSVTTSTVSQNTSDSNGGGFALEGLSATSTITDTTVADNTVLGAQGPTGGIFVPPAAAFTGSLTLNNCTISGTPVTGADGVSVANRGTGTGTGTVTVNSSIVSSSSIGGSVAGNHNVFLLDNGEFFPNGKSNPPHFASELHLIPLADNGGTGPTMAIDGSSFLVNAGSNPTALATDGRGAGFDRVIGSAADIGAFELAESARPLAIGGLLDGTALVATPTGGQLQAGSVIPFFPGSAVNVRTASADVNGDGVIDFVGGTGPGVPTMVVVVDGKTNTTMTAFAPFEASFTGGVFVAAADIDGDGKADLVVTPDQGGGPIAAVYGGSKLAAGLGDAAQLNRFFGIEDPAFRGGARPALGDVDGDGRADLVVSAGILGGPRIAIFNGTSIATPTPTHLVGDFFAFESTLRNGAFVAVGDVTGDGHADLSFGGGPGGGPRVRVFDGAKLLSAGPFGTLDAIAGTAQIANFFAGDASLRGGVHLAMADVDDNGIVDLITGSGEGEATAVRVFKAATLLAMSTPAADQTLDPFNGSVLANGVFVG
jgi:hypothetical protein